MKQGDATAKVEPGWYTQDGATRYWTGSAWAQVVEPVKRNAPAGGPEGYLIVGALLGILAGIVLGVGLSESDMAAMQILGWVLSAIASVVLSIGIVAKGVQVGRRSS